MRVDVCVLLRASSTVSRAFGGCVIETGTRVGSDSATTAVRSDVHPETVDPGAMHSGMARPVGIVSEVVRHTIRSTWRADADVSLPPLPTTSIRGAVLATLRDMVCIELDRAHCGGCPQLSSCAFPALTPEGARDDDGAQDDRALSPLVLRPLTPAWTGRPHALTAGDAVTFDLVLVGPRAIAEAKLVDHAVRAAARRGLGEDGVTFRAALPVVVEPKPRSASNGWQLRFTTPLRLKVDGRVVDAAHFNVSALWRAMVRRTLQVVDLTGLARPTLPTAPPFALQAARLHDARAKRWSNRQGGAVSWPGVVGSVELRVDEAAAALVGDVLTLIADVGLGKGTSFGCGAVELICFAPGMTHD